MPSAVWLMVRRGGMLKSFSSWKRRFVKVEADRQPPTPWSHILACVMVCVVLLALIGCEMFFDVPEYFQLAWRGVFVFVSLSFAVTQMDL